MDIENLRLRLRSTLNSHEKVEVPPDATLAELEYAVALLELCKSTLGRLNVIDAHTKKRFKRKAAPIKLLVEPPFGFYGEWDYFNAHWKRNPELSDIPDICRQKLLRYPDNPLWSSEEEVAKWMKDKGYL